MRSTLVKRDQLAVVTSRRVPHLLFTLYYVPFQTSINLKEAYTIVTVNLSNFLNVIISQ